MGYYSDLDSDVGACGEASRDLDILEREQNGGLTNREKARKKTNQSHSRIQYEKNIRAKVGTIICCANCKKEILKKSYQTQFCGNRGKGNCKDLFWNKSR